MLLSSAVKLYNTLTRKVEDLKPEDDDKVRMYVCGVTVYDSSHIGHARTVIVFDVLRRYLMAKGYKVKFVQNFTDVDDKIINRAKTEGKKAEEISSKYIDAYFHDFSGLNVLAADVHPKATEHITEMINLIKGLVDKGYAYLTLNGVYFRVKKFAGYGKLSRKPVEELEAGARIEVDQSKEDPMDFALWKFSSEPPFWDSPWGKGRPGWHIECSAMALKYLGNTFEIHGGGHDLVFPHHENEIAQSESFTGAQFAKIWMHSGMVTINSQKMSKSLGNIVTIEKALERWGANTLRLYCVSVHYAKPLDYTEELLKESAQRWRQIETCAFELASAAAAGNSGDRGDADAVARMAAESEQAFDAAMDDDLNTSLALTAFLQFVTKLNQYAASDKLTGDMAKAALPAFGRIMSVLGLKVAETGAQEQKEVEEMVAARNRLRAEKKFKDADEIRKSLLARSIELMDHKGRTVWKKVERPEQ
ncbi:cysteinyl-tRNA synthetase [Candidatus Nitrososphaera evergladensis SR1]|uniref:Cysteine--tRNA ligase n=1 Tax=Candidatus Nitrososphaera evergladensis SR1 TaxID=1459636 RepID=A0A075MW18_9ARCH|nr:cysteinyl-tRNA synthetase [Candidatus Nitrososphaera evergladensis SR1]